MLDPKEMLGWLRNMIATIDGDGGQCQRTDADLEGSVVRATSMAARCRSERDQARADFLQCAEAVGIVHHAEGHAIAPGSVEEVERAIREAVRAAEWRGPPVDVAEVERLADILHEQVSRPERDMTEESDAEARRAIDRLAELARNGANRT